MPDHIEPGSPSARVMAELAKDVERSFSRSDIATLLSIAPGAVDRALEPGITGGMITVANDADHGRVWRAGPRLKIEAGKAPAAAPAAAQTAFGQPAAKPAETPKPAKKTSSNKPHSLPPLDLSKIPLLKDSAPPKARRMQKGATRYDSLFAEMEADGTARVGIPKAYMHSVQGAVKTYLAARPTLAAKSVFIVRSIDDNSFGVWRLAKTDPQAMQFRHKLKAAA